MSGCSCHVETIAPLVMMSNYQNEAEIRDHVFGKEPLRPPHAARSRAQLYATGAIRGRPDMGWKAHATWHGLSSPWVWDGPSALCPRQLLRPPISPFPPIKNPSVCSVGQPSVLRPPPSALRDASTTDMRVGPLFPSQNQTSTSLLWRSIFTIQTPRRSPVKNVGLGA